MRIKYYIKAILLSLYSKGFYANLFATNLSPVRYLALLSVLVAVPAAYEVKNYVSYFRDDSGLNNLEYIKEQLPEVLVNGDDIKFDTENNINILNKSGNVVAIIDVENKVDDLSRFEKVLVVNNNSLLIKLPEKNSTIGIDLTGLKDSFKQYQVKSDGRNKIDLGRFLDDFSRAMETPVAIVFILSFAWYLLAYMVTALIYSILVGFIAKLMLKTSSFNFKLNFKIAVFTSTAVICLDILTNILGHSLFTNMGLVYFIVHLIYIHFAIESYKKLGHKH